MPRRRLMIIALFVAVPLVAFGVAFALTSGGEDGTDLASDRSTTTREPTTTTEATTTTAAPTTTTSVAPPKLGPGSPLPSVPQPGEPVAGSAAPELATQLSTAWASVLENKPDVARQAHVYQVAVRALSNKTELREPTYALLTEPVLSQVRSDVEAGAKLRSLVGKPRTALPPWRIVDPPAAEELLSHYKTAGANHDVPWYYLAAINLVESRMGRIRGTSEANAQGPMQFLPSTWEQYGEGGDINSYADAIAAAARYLKRNGAPSDMRNAIWNYNHDYRYVDAVIGYGDRMKADERAFRSYYGWQVYYVTTAGDIWLPVGYGT